MIVDMNSPEKITYHHMIIARRAKEKTDEVNKKSPNDVLNEVISGINQSISRGVYYYDYDFIDVSDTQLKNTKDTLEFCGYVVGPKPGAYPKTFLRISWFNPS